MATTITEASTFGATITAPSDGDNATAAGTRVALQGLANRTKFIKDAIDPGLRQSIGPFTATLAADQTAVATTFSGLAGAGGWVAPRAGSVTAVSAMLDAAITGASKTATARVFKNGVLLNAALDLLFTTGGAEVAKYATAAQDAHVFAAGDVIDVRYTSTTITNTPKMWVNVEIEC